MIVPGKAGLLQRVLRIAQELIVPRGVSWEIAAGTIDDPAKVWLQSQEEQFVRETSPISPRVAAWDLGLGEREVLTWATEHGGFKAVIDDRAARRCAKALGVPVLGTLGLLILEKRSGQIQEMRPALDSVVAAGLRIDETLYLKCLALVGEQ